MINSTKQKKSYLRYTTTVIIVFHLYTHTRIYNNSFFCCHLNMKQDFQHKEKLVKTSYMVNNYIICIMTREQRLHVRHISHNLRTNWITSFVSKQILLVVFAFFEKKHLLLSYATSVRPSVMPSVRLFVRPSVRLCK